MLIKFYSWCLDGPQCLQNFIRDFRCPDPRDKSVGPIADYMIGKVIGHVHKELKTKDS